jgi:hypothetical protein
MSDPVLFFLGILVVLQVGIGLAFAYGLRKFEAVEEAPEHELRRMRESPPDDGWGRQAKRDALRLHRGRDAA